MNEIQLNLANATYDSICDIKYAISNLYCIKLALHGNDEVIPSTQTIDEALIAVGNMLENAVEKIEAILNQEEGDDLQCQK